MAFPLDIQFVKRAEAKLGRKLPLGYVAKMCRENGGEVATGTDSWCLYPIFDDSDRKRLKRTCKDIVRETASAREWPDFPPEAVAIGDNGGGDKLVLLPDPDSERYGDKSPGGTTKPANCIELPTRLRNRQDHDRDVHQRLRAAI